MTESKVKTGTENKENYTGDVVLLQSIAVDNYDEIMDTLGDNAESTAVALRATIQSLHGLWYLPDANWRKLRQNIQVGLIKDTEDYGNTSVSMGFAVDYFKDKFNGGVAFVNCGTGGNKYQYYLKVGGVISIALEYKPKNGSSPNLIKVGGFIPKTEMDFNHNCWLLQCEITEFYSRIKARFPGCPAFITCAFVTGSVREHWEKKASVPDIKSRVEDVIFAYFERAIGPILMVNNSSYLINQNLEARMEFAGTSAMYAQLAKSGNIRGDVRVAMSFGIGRGSSQIIGKVGEKCIEFNQRVGMNNSGELDNLAHLLLPAFKKEIDSLVSIFHSNAPIIALKSGCMLFLEKPENSQLRALFGAKPKSVALSEHIRELTTAYNAYNSVVSAKILKLASMAKGEKHCPEEEVAIHMVINEAQ